MYVVTIQKFHALQYNFTPCFMYTYIRSYIHNTECNYLGEDKVQYKLFHQLNYTPLAVAKILR